MAQPASQTQSSQAPGSGSAQQQQQQQQQNQQQNQQQRHLVVVVESTGALGPAWPAIRSEYVDKVVRAFCGQDGTVQAGAAEMALVAYGSHSSSSASLFQHSGWTSSPDVFLDWLGSIEFFGGGFGGAALTEGLAQALLMCCPEQSVLTTQSIQRHCLLVGASNPHPLPTPVLHPPLNISTDSHPDHWWLADSEAVAKAFPQCHVSLSVICPRQLPSLKTLYQLAKQRTTDAVVDVARNSQHLALISENFVEASTCFCRPSPVVSTVAATSATAPAASSIKAEQQPASASTGLPNSTIPATSGAAASTVTAAVRTSIPLPASTVKLEQTPMLGLQRSSAPMASSTMLSNASPLPQPIPSSTPASVSTQDALRPAALSPDGSAVTTSQDFKPAGSNPLQRPAVAANILNSVARHVPGSLPLAAGSGGSLSVSNILPAGVGTGSMPVPVGQGSLGTSISVGGGTGILHSLTGTAAGMMGPSTGTTAQAASSSGLIQNMVGLGQAAGTLAPGVQLTQNGLGISHALAGQGSAVNVANPGLSQLQGTGLSTLPGPGGIPQPQPVQAASTPPQASGAKYTKLWQGVLAGQRQGKPIPICQLEGYRQSSSPETLANDWPQTMQILRLIPQDYMTNKEYQEKAELLVFKPLAVYKQSGHPITFLHQLAEKKLCAVIQLPSQTLLLASAADKPQRMIGMLFPGDMVVVKPQVATQQQQLAAQQGQVAMQQQVAQQQQQQQSQQLMSSPQSGFM